MGIEVIGGSSAADAGGGGIDSRIFPIIVGTAFIEDTWDAGFFIVKAYSNTSTDFNNSTARFFDSSQNLLGTITLTDRMANTTSSEYSGSILLTTPVAYLNVSSSVQSVDGWVEVQYFPTPVTKRIIKLTSSQTYALSETATVYCIGGGGGGAGGSIANATGGGGGSGYLSSGIITSGSYSAVIGGGGAPTQVGIGGTGTATTFSTISAPGGSPGITANTTSAGGSGGSGGGAGNKSEGGATYGGANGEAGQSSATATGGAGSGVALPMTLPASVRAVGTFVPGGLYAGGTGAEFGQLYGMGSAAANTGGGGASSSQSQGGAGGSGVIFIVI